MRKSVLMVFGFLFIFSSEEAFSQKEANNGYKVIGNIKGLKNDSVLIAIINFDKDGKRLDPEIISTKAQNDSFSFLGTTATTKNVSVALGNRNSRRNFTFYLEPGSIRIEGDIDTLNNVLISGTKTNHENFKVRSFTNDIYNRIVSLREELKKVSKESDTYRSLMSDINLKFDSIQNYEVDFIKNNPNSFVSATLLYVKQDKLPMIDLESYFNSFPKEIQNSSFGFTIRQKIKARKLVAIGNPAPDFISKDTSGREVRLSDFRGKYVLLEFWANWCVPCRVQHPHLVEMYEKYKDQGFTIIQYSIDELAAADKWKAAIIKDNLVWTQASDLERFNSKVAKLYGVQPIPDNFLIDPEGKIVGRRLFGNSLDEKLKEVLK